MHATVHPILDINRPIFYKKKGGHVQTIYGIVLDSQQNYLKLKMTAKWYKEYTTKNGSYHLPLQKK